MFTVRNIFLLSIVGMLALLVVLFIFNGQSYTKLITVAGLAYLAVSLAFSIAGFILVLRRFGVAPDRDLAIRGLAILGAVIVFCVWAVLVYPVFVHLP
jgi:amino acid transporter